MRASEFVVQEGLKKNLATAALAGVLSTSPTDTQAHVIPGSYGTNPDAAEVSQEVPKSDFEIKGVRFGMTPEEISKVLNPNGPEANTFGSLGQIAKNNNFTILGFSDIRFMGTRDEHLMVIEVRSITWEHSVEIIDFFNKKYGKAKTWSGSPRWNGRRISRAGFWDWKSGDIEISFFSNQGVAPGTQGDKWVLRITSIPHFNDTMAHYRADREAEFEKRERDF